MLKKSLTWEKTRVKLRSLMNSGNQKPKINCLGSGAFLCRSSAQPSYLLLDQFHTETPHYPTHLLRHTHTLSHLIYCYRYLAGGVKECLVTHKKADSSPVYSYCRTQTPSLFFCLDNKYSYRSAVSVGRTRGFYA